VPGVCAAEKWRAVERERERERGERKEKREGERLTDRDKSERDSWESQRQREARADHATHTTYGTCLYVHVQYVPYTDAIYLSNICM